MRTALIITYVPIPIRANLDDKHPPQKKNPRPNRTGFSKNER